jgi:hypothetical protein
MRMGEWVAITNCDPIHAADTSCGGEYPYSDGGILTAGLILGELALLSARFARARCCRDLDTSTMVWA